MIEEHEPNKLKAEIYRLRYEHQKLEHAKQQLKTQKEDIEKVRGYREELIEQMQAHKMSEEMKRESLNKYIEEQRKIISEKEQLIKSKNDTIAQMEEEYNEKLRELREQYNEELKKKKELDKELQSVKEELETIEFDYPKQIRELKEQISNAKYVYILRLISLIVSVQEKDRGVRRENKTPRWRTAKAAIQEYYWEDKLTGF